MWAWAIQTADIGQPDFADFKIGRVKSKKNQIQMVRLFSQLLYYLSGVYGIIVWTDWYKMYPGQIEAKLKTREALETAVLLLFY